MPYIEPVRQDRLAYTPFESADLAQDVGEFTYLLFVAAKSYGFAATEQSYARHAEVITALDNAKEEYRRRFLNPYEDQKREENGDV